MTTTCRSEEPTMTSVLTTRTPAEIDAELAPLEYDLAVAHDRAEQYAKLAEKAPAPMRAGREARAAECEAKVDELLDKVTPLRAEYARRPWTRAFLCTASNGHLHRTTSCSTTFPTTRFHWCFELSGLDEAQIVELAGERACTVCYPDAPVSTLGRESRLAWDVQAREEKAARDAERAAKRAAKDAKAITNPDGTPLRDSSGYVIATMVTAWREVVSDLADVELYGYRWNGEKQATQDRIVAALVAKLGRTEEDVRAEVAAKVAAKVKRDRR